MAYLLYPYAKEIQQLAYDITDLSTRRFAEAETFSQRASWLDALLHFTPRDYLFCDVYDDAEYERLLAWQEEVEAHWLAGIRPLLEGVENPFAGQTLSERLGHLLYFYHQNINALSGGDDERACALLASANREFERCREDLFSHNSSLITHNSNLDSLYYFVLCAVRPDQTSPDNARHYRQYFLEFSERYRSEQDEDLCWQFREIEYHHQQALDTHDDQTALAGLWLARPEACTAFRQQLYRWHLDSAPSAAVSLDEATRQATYANEGLSRLSSWLLAKQSAGIPVPAERQADLLMTYALARCVGASDCPLGDYFYQHAYDVLSRLQPSKQKTHLKVCVEALLSDEHLLAEAKAEANTWSVSELTQEDRYLLEDLSHAVTKNLG